MYQKYINELKKQKGSNSEIRFVALQLLELHTEAIKR